MIFRSTQVSHPYFRMNFKPSLEAWKSILSISSRFQMTHLRTRAIDKITTFSPRIDPVDQIVLAVQYDISEWLSTGYTALVERESPLECDEARKLGVDTTCLIAKARERYRHTTESQGDIKPNAAPVTPHPFWAKSSSPPPLHTQADHTERLDRIVQDIFFPQPKAVLESPPVITEVHRFLHIYFPNY